jgi:glycosyltransferase involved in cell wall biosynthesis
MRVLFVVHDFLPRHPLGTEIYAWKLGRELQARGHEVRVLTTEKDVARPHLSVRERVWDGLPVTELTNNLFYERFEETWDWPPARAALAAVLDEFRPDVVHVMHLMYLSLDCVTEVARRGIPVFYTLHDFWLQCARMGQRLHPDGTTCEVIDHDRCGACLADFKWGQTGLERRTARVLAGIRNTTGLDLSEPIRSAAAWARGSRAAGGASHAVDPATVAARTRDVGARERAVLDGLVPRVHRFLAPSRFLRDRFVEWGIPAERIEHSPYGIDVGALGDVARTPRGDRLRVAFVGSLRPHKGPQVLLAAWQRLAPALRDRGELRIFGPDNNDKPFLAELRALAQACGAELMGELPRSEVGDTLARTDVLVVPSTWYENSPLVIHEALATDTALVVSDLGGMAELVEPGKTGWRFATGDADDLARVLGELLADPARLDALSPAAGTVRTVADDGAQMERRYAEARA